jgi:hypothetical protein
MAGQGKAGSASLAGQGRQVQAGTARQGRGRGQSRQETRAKQAGRARRG